MRGVKAFIVLLVASFNLSVVPGRVWPDLFVANTVFRQPFPKQREIRYERKEIPVTDVMEQASGALFYFLIFPSIIYQLLYTKKI